LTQLVECYFEDIAPHFPVLTKREFMHGVDEEGDEGERLESSERDGQSGYACKPRPPALLCPICVIAATARHIPAWVFKPLLDCIIPSEDSPATIANVQALLISGMATDVRGGNPGQSASTALIREYGCQGRWHVEAGALICEQVGAWRNGSSWMEGGRKRGGMGGADGSRVQC
jgi:hypothetical protein